MHPILNRNLFFVKEHVGFLKAANNYDILDPETGETIIHCREEKLSFITKMLRFTDWKTLTPFEVDLTTPDGQPLLTVKRGATFFISKVDVLDGKEQRVGGFKQKWFSLGGAFKVLDEQDNEICQLKGKWTGWDFRFLSLDGSVEFASVTKKWSGLGKELFTSADNYILQISDDVPPNNSLRYLILGAVMSIDMVLKER